MKLTDTIFWVILAAVAFFYIFEGNDMHHKKWERIDKVFEKDENTTKTDTK